MIKHTVLIFALLFAPIVHADSLLGNITQSNLLTQQTTIVPVDQAFAVSTELVDDNVLRVRWDVVSDVYLYDDQFSFVGEGVTLGEPEWPAGELKEDEVLGKYYVHYGPLQIDIPIVAWHAEQATVTLHYQGCSDSGYCYPPLVETVRLALADNSAVSLAPASVAAPPVTTASLELNQHDRVTQLLFNQHLLWVVIAFLGFGLLLTFTPCVLPMVPILSSIIVGQNHTMTKRRALFISSSYVLGVAVTYALAGVLAAMAGHSLQAVLQKSWVLIVSSGLFVLLALAMFGVYELRLPNRLSQRIGEFNQKQKGGSMLGALGMGSFSALVVSPCITPPLVGALAYIGQTGDTLLGGIALFSLGLGMGIPLIVVATLGVQFIPKAGPWMNVVRAVFGVLLLAVAIWLIERIVPGPVALVLWASLLMVSAIYLGALDKARTQIQRLWKGVGCLLFTGSVVLLVGAGMGNSDPLRPLEGLMITASDATATSSGPSFKLIKNVADLNQELAQAKLENKPVMLDFYADWCASCVLMHRTTFVDPMVRKQLQDFVVLKADVTRYDEMDRALQQQFNVYAPPTILFFTPDGEEITTARLVGGVNAAEFQQHLDKVKVYSQAP